LVLKSKIEFKKIKLFVTSSDPYTGGDTEKRTVVRKLIPFVDRLGRWFLVVSDSRIQTGRKIIMDTKK